MGRYSQKRQLTIYLRSVILMVENESKHMEE